MFSEMMQEILNNLYLHVSGLVYVQFAILDNCTKFT